MFAFYNNFCEVRKEIEAPVWHKKKKKIKTKLARISQMAVANLIIFAV